MGWELHPEGLYEAIAGAAERTGLPVYVTENGIATADDAERVEFLRTHLEQVARALSDGHRRAQGTSTGSSFDNFEWGGGLRCPTFGLIGQSTARQTWEGPSGPSARALAEVIRRRTLSPLV
jgi:beta-glucosidase